MKKSNITINAIENTIIVSKSFYKKASTYGTSEYQELRKAMNENSGFAISFKTIEKKTYNGLDFARMEAYIKTQPKSAERLAEFEEIKKVASAKGSLYPLTKKWFFETYPEYKTSEIKLTADSKSNTVENVESNTKAFVA